MKLKTVVLDFDIDDLVELTEEGRKINGGRPIKGIVDYIKINHNQKLYGVLYNTSENGMQFRVTELPSFFLRKV